MDGVITHSMMIDACLNAFEGNDLPISDEGRLHILKLDIQESQEKISYWNMKLKQAETAYSERLNHGQADTCNMDGLILKQEIPDNIGLCRYTVMVDGVQRAISFCTDDEARLKLALLGTHYEKVPKSNYMPKDKQSYI